MKKRREKGTWGIGIGES